MAQGRPPTVSARRLRGRQGLPGIDPVAAMHYLLAAIARLEDFKANPQYQRERRLAQLMKARTGTLPLGAVLLEYQRLVLEPNDTAVHTTASAEQVRELLDRALALIMLVFVPVQVQLWTVRIFTEGSVTEFDATTCGDSSSRHGCVQRVFRRLSVVECGPSAW